MILSIISLKNRVTCVDAKCQEYLEPLGLKFDYGNENTFHR